jgi:hypothetical protein
MWPRALYRAGQFFRYLSPAPLNPAELARVDSLLTPALAALFRRMSPGEQAHSLAVLQRAQQQIPPAPPELLQAALLHDVGKSVAPLTIIDRVLIVLGYSLFPKRASQWGTGEPRGWRKPFVVAQQHPAWGADLAERAGAAPLVVNLIRRHQEGRPASHTVEDELLVRLQFADNES